MLPGMSRQTSCDVGPGSGTARPANITSVRSARRPQRSGAQEHVRAHNAHPAAHSSVRVDFDLDVHGARLLGVAVGLVLGAEHKALQQRGQAPVRRVQHEVGPCRPAGCMLTSMQRMAASSPSSSPPGCRANGAARGQGGGAHRRRGPQQHLGDADPVGGIVRGQKRLQVAPAGQGSRRRCVLLVSYSILTCP